ncbi:MAG: N-acetyltransferase [Planctomycetota bacterium]|nr:N-acetyltransferase [Planctomycetota bacterium]
MDIRYRPARLADVPAIAALINGYAERKLMLPRTTSELYEHVRDFIVADADPGGLCGCVALHIDTDRIAEIKALAVAEPLQGRGIGRRLVHEAIAEAERLGIERVFCLTYQEAFFAKLGFTRVDRSRLPDKVWSECVRCHRFLDCDEVAMWRPVHQADVACAPAAAASIDGSQS